jgi:hypothetical protein
MEEKIDKIIIGGKSFHSVKFGSSLAPYQKAAPALTGDKQSKEFVLSMIFAQFLFFHGTKTTKIEVNEDDSHGNPDILMVINGKKKGIQLTKISLNDPLRRINIAKKQINELLNLIPQDIELLNPINVSIRLDSSNKNAIPKGTMKQKKELAELIASKIREKRGKIFGENPELISVTVENSNLSNLATSFTINSLPSGHFPTFIGKNGIHISYDFDTHHWDIADLYKEIERIIKSKEGGTEDLLLIWADRFEILYQDEKVAEVLNERFKETSFKQVFFLVLFDRMDMFLGSWSVWKIK